jgi:CheY-like chemotaxis protein
MSLPVVVYTPPAIATSLSTAATAPQDPVRDESGNSRGTEGHDVPAESDVTGHAEHTVAVTVTLGKKVPRPIDTELPMQRFIRDNGRVVLADDSAFNRSVMSRLLMSIGVPSASIIVVESGNQAIDAVRTILESIEAADNQASMGDVVIRILRKMSHSDFTAFSGEIAVFAVVAARSMAERLLGVSRSLGGHSTSPCASA